MVDKNSGRGKRLFRYSIVLLIVVVAGVLILNFSLSQSKVSVEDILLKKQSNSSDVRSVHITSFYRSPENFKHSNFDQKQSSNNNSVKQIGSPTALQKQKYPIHVYEIGKPIPATTVGPAVSWNDFILHSLQRPIDIESHRYRNTDQTSFKLCPIEMVQKLKQKTLERKDIEWCKWATSSTGGKVVVGKSWGNLRSVTERKKFDSLNCNSVITSGINPSCDDAWGDESVTNW